jgi:hypothetical protein
VLVLCFLLFLCFKKATQEIFSELDETKAEPPIFPEHESESKAETEGARTWPHPRAAWVKPWPHHQGVSPSGPLLDAALSPIYSPRREKTETPDQFSTKPTASRRHRRCEIRRVQKLFPAPCQRGESPPEAFFITMVASGVICD